MIDMTLSVPVTRYWPSAKIDVAGIGFHHIGGELLALFDDGIGRRLERIAADHHAARTIGAAADRDLRGVALHIADRFEGHAEQFVGELGEHRGVALAVRMGAGEDRERAARIEAQVHALVEDAAELDVEAHRAAAQLAALFRCLLARRETLRDRRARCSGPSGG